VSVAELFCRLNDKRLLRLRLTPSNDRTLARNYAQKNGHLGVIQQVSNRPDQPIAVMRSANKTSSTKFTIDQELAERCCIGAGQTLRVHSLHEIPWVAV